MIKGVDDPSVANVLSTDDKKIYRIPRYQREYTWRQHDWASLYDDVFGNDPGYFLGSIIVIQGPVSASSGIYEYEVIDGQQRLTTISLLLAALYKQISGYDDLIDEDLRADEVVPLRNRLVFKQDKKQTRVIPQVQNNNLADFRWIMREVAGLKDSMQVPKNFGNRRMARAFGYFVRRLEDEVEGLKREGALSKLLGMVSRLCSAVFVQIDVDSHADAYTLFASLNNRGVPLSAVDLIKNTLLSKIGCDDSDLDYYFEQWQEILRRLGDDYTTQERFFRQNYDAFRRAANRPYAVEGKQFPLGSVATRSNLLAIYERRIGDDATGVLSELMENSALYARIICSDADNPDSELDKQLLELSRAQGVPSYLMLLYLLKNRGVLGLVDDDLAEIVDVLVRFFVRRNVTDTPPTYILERLFIALCEEIEDGGFRGARLLAHVKRRLVDVSASDELFRKRLEGPIYDVNPDMCRYILTRLAAPSVTKEMKGLWDRYQSGSYVWTIEHIFPQGRKIPKSWVDMMGEGSESLARDIQETHVHTLGNLTISGYNSKLGNLSFAEKRDRKDQNGAYVGYRNGINLNEDLVGSNTWNRERIESRTKKLVNKAMELFSFGE